VLGGPHPASSAAAHTTHRLGEKAFFEKKWHPALVGIAFVAIDIFAIISPATGRGARR
jgi:hypothetical protein